jgi:acetyltransferase-like isoleucine patch superfamily enzyme
MSMQLIQRLLYRVKRAWWTLTVIPALRAAGVEIAEKVQMQGRPIVSMVSGSRIQIGARCVLCSDSQINALGINHPVVLRTLRPGAEIVIGGDTGMSGGSICAAGSIRIGTGCLIGANVTLADTDFHALNPVNRRYNRNPDEIAVRPILIEDNVFIGADVVVLKGVTIGKNSVIGAGSVVTRDIPENTIAAGNPAKVIKLITQ